MPLTDIQQKAAYRIRATQGVGFADSYEQVGKLSETEVARLAAETDAELEATRKALYGEVVETPVESPADATTTEPT